MGALTDLRFEVEYEMAAPSVDRALEVVLRAVEAIEWPNVVGVASPIPTKPGKGTRAKQPDLAKLLEEAATQIKVPGNFRLGFGNLSWLSMAFHGDSARGSLLFSLADNLFPDPADNLDRQIWFVRRLLSQEALIEATFTRHGDRAGGCVPSVPLAKRRTPLVVTTDAQIAELYDRPDEFLSAGWEVERFGKKVMLTRLRKSLSRAQVTAETRDYQWQMARAAKPGKVRWEFPVIESEEKATFEEGDARLELVGVTAAGLAEFSCSLVEGEHLAGFDVYYIQEIVEAKQLRNGTPVSMVNVVFEDRWMAESEKRPLLDVGARVFYMDAATNEDVELTV